MSKSHIQFWEYLSQNIDQGARARIEKLALQNNQSFPVTIAQLGLAPDTLVTGAYRSALNLPIITAADILDETIMDDGVSVQFLRAHKLLPMDQSGELMLAMVDPFNEDGYKGYVFASGAEPQRAVIGLTDWRAAFERLYGLVETVAQSETAESTTGRAGWADDATRLKDMASEAPVIRRVERLLTHAADLGASDIHVEPAPNVTRIRFRIDGVMQAPQTDSPDMAALIVSRIKVMCDMDVADSRRPQDGRTSAAVRGRNIDLRVSTVPTAYGESLAIRLLDRSAALLDLNNIGFSTPDLELIQSVLQNPKGIFLVTGPTGSGKTTTLYAALNRLRQRARKILTVEDPIEYFFDDINQVQVNEAAGVSFASALRSFLRQDPDIMMVGEIRDAETARIAVQAALTGHLVLSTLHTNDAVSAISRLKDLGVEEYLIAATVSGVTAQRLVRKLCAQCRIPVKGARPAQYLAAGCAACNEEGYLGRTVISEGYRVTPQIADFIRQGAPETAIFAKAVEQGMTLMLDDGRAKAARGDVLLDDVYAAAGHS